MTFFPFIRQASVTGDASLAFRLVRVGIRFANAGWALGVARVRLSFVRQASVASDASLAFWLVRVGIRVARTLRALGIAVRVHLSG